MKKDIEEIFNLALDELKNGSSIEHILLKYPQEEKELAPLLSTAKAFLEMPKNTVPQPAMQRKFMLEPAKARLGFAWLKFYKYAGISMSFVLLVSAIATTAYGAFKSLPGETLFSLKKSAEQLQLSLATTPQAQATLHLEIAQKRLADATKVINNPGSNAAQQTAAITELLSETSKSINAVSTAAKSEPKALASQPIVTTLAKITSDQQTLIKQIKKEDPSIANNVQHVNDENTTKIAEIQKYIEVASNEQSLTHLGDGKNSTTTAASIVLGANTTSPASLAGTSSSTISGIKNSDTASSSKKSETKIKEEETPPAVDPNTVIGSFIIEDPKPQSVFK